MKIHTTNYTNTFIEVADDCPVAAGAIPPGRGDAKSVAQMQYKMVSRSPYRFTSDDVLFQVFAERNGLTKREYAKARAAFFSRGQACLRSSPLTKRYGWGVHSDAEAKVALYGAETPEYHTFSNDKNLTVVKAMRSRKG